MSMNTVWPYANPTETYRYYDLPFCQPELLMPHFMTLGQVLCVCLRVRSAYGVGSVRVLCEPTWRTRSVSTLWTGGEVWLGYVWKVCSENS